MIDLRQNALVSPEAVATIAGPYEKDVVLSRRVEADSSRVFYALSIPEYIEAWLLFPDMEDAQLFFELPAPQTFHINLYRDEVIQTTVHGSCRVVGANQIRYGWKSTSSNGTTETVVDMHVLCASGGCTVSLRHSGFRDHAESARYCTMWQQSLDKLCRLMKRS